MIKNNKKLFNIAIILLLAMANLYAINIPKLSKFDKRITYATYNADDVVLVKCKEGFVSIIEFDKDERIVNIATGFSDGWEVMDKDNYLFIKPKSYTIKSEEQNMTDENGEQVEFYGSSVIQPNPTDWKTNLIITTNKDKVYTFDLELGEASKINYKLTFNYITPKEKIEKEKADKELAQKIAKEKAEYQKEIERNTIPRNWNFVMHVNKNSDTIVPDYAYDDGVFTYLGFSSTKTIPSVFLYDEINKESILNSHVKKDGKYDVVVIHKTAEKILLRSGDKLVGIINKGYGQNPLDKTYSTNKDNIQREIISNE
ncbi:P-type conjugative transfer protein VirB9 [Campylobacter fetus]|uniref:P-type conjugative transfer protein VirB9 n=1 Tax=Campylobacter fetus TaxID=196 RepID=A0A825B8M4_CAMFE|nr:P-type conjugative transfer protein VirB9 [Campylobacter fetus]EGK8193083.1 P-type conjugative transfer protein VirB9 [Campylobacter fetus]